MNMLSHASRLTHLCFEPTNTYISTSSLDETPRLLSRIKYRKRGIFLYMSFNVDDQLQ